MHYYFTSDSRAATGLLPRDPEPRHVHCDARLAMEPFVEGHQHHPHSRWRCAGCGSAGWLQYLPEYIRRRTEELPGPPRKPDPPDSPSKWQEYLDDYFADGVLFLGVLDEPGYPVRETSVFVLSDEVRVGLGPMQGPELTVLDRAIGRPFSMRDVQAITQTDPGTLIVHGTEGRKGRLDARLTDDERAHVHRLKHSDYFGVAHSCGKDACPYCEGLEAKGR